MGETPKKELVTEGESTGRETWQFSSSARAVQIVKTHLANTTQRQITMAPRIDTFVFIDVETTDLIRGSVMPDITELALVAVSRRYILADTDQCGMIMPRIMHKLTIPVCPQQSISAQASRITNLSNESLCDARRFDEDTCRLIKQFLRRLPGIICFVAHNGNRFDYKVLLSELGNQNEYFPTRLRCVDTMDAFKIHFAGETYRPPNYKLSTLHEYIIGCDTVNQHCAEEDCLTLLRCVRQMDIFAQWADNHAIRLNEI